ncbi:hypothetical protein D3C87_248330 [compost metagenome]
MSELNKQEQDQLNDQWDTLKNPENALKSIHAEANQSPTPKIVRDDEFTQIISLPSQGGTAQDAYSRSPGGLWFSIHYVAPENMTIAERRKEIQRLADAHEDAARLQATIMRRYPANVELPPEGRSILDWLIRLESRARAEYDAAIVGWHEPVYITPRHN